MLHNLAHVICYRCVWGELMRRRHFLALLSAGAAAPIVLRFGANAEPVKMPTIGFLDRGSPIGMSANLAGFRNGLGESGCIEGKNVKIEYRWAKNHTDQLPALAAELAALPVAVIAATRSSAPALAAKRVTSTIPIVFQTGSDPVKDGLVASFNRPGGNVTGATRLTTELISKRLEFIAQLAPKAVAVALLVNPNGVQTALQVQEMLDSTHACGLALNVVKVSSEGELEPVFRTLAQSGASVLIEGSDPLFLDLRKRIVELTIRNRIPTIFFERDSVVDGGLMSYSANFADSFRQVGSYVGRILKGERPANLPVLRAAKFDLIINMKSARDIGVSIPPNLLAIADEVIE